MEEKQITISFVNFYQTNLYFFYVNLLILCDISPEFYLNYKFIITKIINMIYNCAVTSFKHLIYFQENLKFLMKWKCQ